MVLGGLAHDEGVELQAARGRGVEHGRGHGVRPHRQAADGVDLLSAVPGLLKHVDHDVADEGRGLVVKSGAAHVDVEVGLEAGGQGDLAVDDGEVADELGEAGALRVVRAHPTRLGDRRPGAAPDVRPRRRRPDQAGGTRIMPAGRRPR